MSCREFFKRTNIQTHLEYTRGEGKELEMLCVCVWGGSLQHTNNLTHKWYHYRFGYFSTRIRILRIIFVNFLSIEFITLTHKYRDSRKEQKTQYYYNQGYQHPNIQMMWNTDTDTCDDLINSQKIRPLWYQGCDFRHTNTKITQRWQNTLEFISRNTHKWTWRYNKNNKENILMLTPKSNDRFTNNYII